MDSENKLLLKKKLEGLKAEKSRQQEENERKRIIENVDDFHEKYRFADEAESRKINEFIGKLDLSSPTHISASEKAEPSPHGNMYLCFLCGSNELLKTYISGSYENLMLDYDNWDFFSPYLLLIDEDFSRYIHIDDNGKMSESSVSENLGLS